MRFSITEVRELARCFFKILFFPVDLLLFSFESIRHNAVEVLINSFVSIKLYSAWIDIVDGGPQK